MSNIVAIVNQKGGVAKTTTANALGLGLSRKGYKVLLIDLDPQGNLSMSLGIPFPDEETKTIAALLLQQLQAPDRCEITPAHIKHRYGVDYIVGNDDLGNIDRMLPGWRQSEFTLDAVLAPVKGQYDYILIDCMPSIGSLTENAIVAADEVLVPSEPQFFSTKGIQSLFNEIGKIQKRNNPSLKVAGILATKVDLRTNVAREFTAGLRSLFSDTVRIFDTMIPLSTKLSECSAGENMYEYDKNGKGVVAYARFIEEYLEQKGGTPDGQ